MNMKTTGKQTESDHFDLTKRPRHDIDEREGQEAHDLVEDVGVDEDDEVVIPEGEEVPRQGDDAEGEEPGGGAGGQGGWRCPAIAATRSVGRQQAK